MTKYTEDQIATALKDAHGLVSVAAKALHVAPNTVYEYLKRHPALKDVLHEARETTIDLAESKLIAAIQKGDLHAIIFYLKTQGKSRGYVERSEHDFSATGAPKKFTIKINGGENLDVGE